MCKQMQFRFFPFLVNLLASALLSRFFHTHPAGAPVHNLLLPAGVVLRAL